MFSIIKGLTNKIYVILLGVISVISGILVWRANLAKQEAQEKAENAEDELLGYETAHTKEYIEAEIKAAEVNAKVQTKTKQEVKQVKQEVIEEYAELQKSLDDDNVTKLKVNL